MANIIQIVDALVMVTSILYFIVFLVYCIYGCLNTKIQDYPKRLIAFYIIFLIYFVIRVAIDTSFFFAVIKNPKTEENDTFWEQLVTVISTIFSRLKYFFVYYFVALAEDVRIEMQTKKED
jgi:hypothetical protein